MQSYQCGTLQSFESGCFLKVQVNNARRLKTDETFQKLGNCLNCLRLRHKLTPRSSTQSVKSFKDMIKLCSEAFVKTTEAVPFIHSRKGHQGTFFAEATTSSVQIFENAEFYHIYSGSKASLISEKLIRKHELSETEHVLKGIAFFCQIYAYALYQF